MTGERTPPHDIDAEEAVIGSLLIDGSCIYKTAPVLDATDFYQEQCRILYAACLALYQRSEAIDQITVAQELDREGRLAACGGAAYLSHLITMVPTSLDVEHYSQIVARLAVSRRLVQAGVQIEAIGYEANPDIDTTLNRAEDVLFRLRHGQTPRDFVPIRQVLNSYFEAPEQEEEGQRAIQRVMSGFAGLDELLSGLGRSDLVIVAGRPSMGKTSFALTIAVNAAVKQGACAAIFSLEMAREALVSRMLASEADVDSRMVRIPLHAPGQVEESLEERRIMNAIGVLSEAPIYIDDSPMQRVVEMRSKARRLQYESGGIDLIIIDYLQLIQGDTRTDNRVQEIGYISRSLKALARELNVPVLCVSQLSRAVEWRSSHRPQLSDLRESGSIEQDADVVAFIYRDEYYYTREEWAAEHPEEDYPAGVAEIIVAKHRNGPIGQIPLHFSPKSARFADHSRQESGLL